LALYCVQLAACTFPQWQVCYGILTLRVWWLRSWQPWWENHLMVIVTSKLPLLAICNFIVEWQHCLRRIKIHCAVLIFLHKEKKYLVYYYLSELIQSRAFLNSLWGILKLYKYAIKLLIFKIPYQKFVRYFKSNFYFFIFELHYILFICGLFFDAVSSSDYIALGRCHMH
jgi:hypothetical protein